MIQNIADTKLNTAQLKSTESGPSNTINQNEELTKLRNRVIELVFTVVCFVFNLLFRNTK